MSGARTPAPALFARGAYDPSAAGGLLAWQRPAAAAVLLRDGVAVALPGSNPALAPLRAAWRAGEDQVVVADPATLVPAATYEAPGAGAVAVSEIWLAWRAPRTEGGDTLWVRPLAAADAPTRVAVAEQPAELGRPVLAGNLLLFHQAGPAGSRIVGLDLATGARQTLRKEPGAMLSNPATDGVRLLYVRATGETQELRIGPLQPRETDRDPPVLVAASPGQRDVEHERGRKRHGDEPLPPRARPGVDDTLWTTALTPTHAYVTRLRMPRDRPRTADIVRVPAVLPG